ncbi:MAG: AAA family ATPase [bacterium]
MKKIIGLTGEIGAGKDTFCQYVKENYQNVFVFRFSDALTEILKMFFDAVKRADQQWLGSSLKERFGDDILVRALIRKVNKIDEGIIILNGVRANGEAEAIKENGGKIIYITAEQKTRWERVCVRKEKSDDDVPYEKFMEMEKASAELPIPKIGAAADFRIENNDSAELFYEEIKKLMESFDNKKLWKKAIIRENLLL